MPAIMVTAAALMCRLLVVEGPLLLQCADRACDHGGQDGWTASPSECAAARKRGDVGKMITCAEQTAGGNTKRA